MSTVVWNGLYYRKTCSTQASWCCGGKLWTQRLYTSVLLRSASAIDVTVERVPACHWVSYGRRFFTNCISTPSVSGFLLGFLVAVRDVGPLEKASVCENHLLADIARRGLPCSPAWYELFHQNVSFFPLSMKLFYGVFVVNDAFRNTSISRCFQSVSFRASGSFGTGPVLWNGASNGWQGCSEWSVFGPVKFGWQEKEHISVVRNVVQFPKIVLLSEIKLVQWKPLPHSLSINSYRKFI